MANIVIIDDEVLVRTLVAEVGIHLGHEVMEASTLAGRRPSLQVQDMDRSQIVGSSPALMKALHALAEAARSDVNVLLMGETGVGKELFAKALYRNSGRAGQAFVTVDCASLTETLVESHLFGHTRGAFTGAERAKEGLLLAAHKGTLFLDEVGDLPLSMQGAFLRALDLRRFRPIGEVREVDSDFRLVAATNKNLSEKVTTEHFRSDLLYRLRGMVVQIPPLRERVEDIPELGRTAVLRFCVQNELPVKYMTEGCLETLLAHDWPGNVRELFHAMERACVAAGNSEELYASHLPTELRVAVARGRVGGLRAQNPAAGEGLAEEPLPTLREWKAKAEADYVQKLMHQCHADVRAAAATAGLSRGHLYELLKKYPAHFRVK